MTEKKKSSVTFSFSHTPGERVTIAIPFASPAGEPPGQDKGAAVNHPLSICILINRSPRPASSLSRLTLPRGNKGDRREGTIPAKNKASYPRSLQV